MTFAHEVETAKELAKQLDTRKKAVEQLEQIMQGMDEDEMEQAFNQCREALEMWSCDSLYPLDLYQLLGDVSLEVRING